MALDGGAGEEEVDLVVGVAEAAEVFDAAEGGLAVGHRHVEVVLFAVLVDGEALGT